MLRALNTLTREWITIYDYKALAPGLRPPLQCPGHSIDGKKCHATPIPCALKSTKMRPYFRVTPLTSHIEGCNESVEELPTIDNNPFLVGIKGMQGPRGPKHLIRVTYRHAPSRQKTTIGANTQTPQPPGTHRTPAQSGRNTPPSEERCGLRKIAALHAAGLLDNNDTIALTRTTKGPVRQIIYTAQRLIRAPHNSRDIITYGRIASISEGNKTGTYFIRLQLPNGKQTKVPIMINSVQSAQISGTLQKVRVNPAGWTVVACGAISGHNPQHQHLDLHSAYSIDFESAPNAQQVRP